MRKGKIFSLLLILGLIVVVFANCEEEPQEVCVQDEPPSCAIEITSCCTDNVCVYKYDGKEYSAEDPDEVNDLLAALSCTGGGSRIDVEAQKSELRAFLADLLARTKAQQ